MAKQTKQKNIEETLWESANKLRGSVESAEYKHVVLGLIFLKFASDKFEEHRKKLLSGYFSDVDPPNGHVDPLVGFISKN
jgi:type I restriction enzyme M protein